MSVTSTTAPVRVALLGAGRIGTSHAELLVHHVPCGSLVAVADPVEGAASRLAERLQAPVAATDPAEVIGRDDVDAVLIAAPARNHTDLVVAAAAAGKHAFVEKPIALSLVDADRSIDAAKAAGVVLQVGFNRRFAPGFAAARAAIDAGQVGTPQLLRSLTRDPGPFTGDPAPQSTIFLETLIHDFDMLCFLNPGARPVSVYAAADALIRPDAKDSGHLDTAVVTVRFDNGAIAVAEASFSALYGYDVRGEVFGSGGMVTVGDARATNMTYYGPAGIAVDTARRDTELLRSSYIGELTAFVDAVRFGTAAAVGGADGRTALAIALAALESVQTGQVAQIAW